jgi:hypothetical protein
MAGPTGIKTAEIFEFILLSALSDFRLFWD